MSFMRRDLYNVAGKKAQSLYIQPVYPALLASFSFCSNVPSELKGVVGYYTVQGRTQGEFSGF